MKDSDTVQKFIELRAQGWSFVRIAAELGVAKSTLTFAHTDFIPVSYRFGVSAGWPD